MTGFRWIAAAALPMLLTLPPAAAGAPPAAQASAPACEARAPLHQTPLVELYTSEGCSSCPPADRWLSGLATPPAGAPTVLAAAFHVGYWDRLGWPDRFAHPAHTARQQALRQASGARYVYTPQVLVNGRDWRGWPVLPLAAATPARAGLWLRRTDREAVQVQVSPGPGVPPRLALWWALLEDGHQSAVQAGENRGERLRHDHVVRHYAELPAWTVQAGASRAFTLRAPRQGEGGRLARLLVVVTDADSGAPLQAAQLACAAGA